MQVLSQIVRNRLYASARPLALADDALDPDGRRGAKVEDLEGVTASFRNALVEILNATEVPAANETQCGNAQDHNLEKAKVYARLFLGSGQ